MTQSSGLLALACGTFALGMAEFSMMGILSPLSQSLHVSIPEAGDFISAYALGVSLGSPLPLLFRNRPLKHILLGLCCVIFAGNLFAASSWGYWSLLVARFLAGLPHGAFFGVGAIVATNMVEPGRRATAVAIMAAGMTMANLFGVPLATWLANSWSWRSAFGIAAAFAIFAFLGILAYIPVREPPREKGLRREFKFLEKSAPWLIFAATFLGQGSIYCWYSYVEPILLNVSHIASTSIKWVMILAGLGMVIGGLLSGKLADRFHASLVSGCTALLIVPTLLLIYFFSSCAPLAIALTFIGAGALFALGGPLQYLIVRYSRGGEILGGAGIQIAFNASNALAAWLGGVVINANLGLAAPALAGVPMAIASAAILFWFYRRYGS
ncbi:MAG: MFS transporter [Desulfovibrio sp.]|nr:MFS transporter [Desulfovibrio sp.]